MDSMKNSVYFIDKMKNMNYNLFDLENKKLIIRPAGEEQEGLVGSYLLAQTNIVYLKMIDAVYEVWSHKSFFIWSVFMIILKEKEYV